MSENPDNPHLHLTVAAIIEKAGRFLLVEEIIKGKNVLNQPAGHVENGESFLAAVRRETLEETAWHFEPEAVTGIYRWRLPGTEETYFRHCFCGQVVAFEAERQLDSDILRTVWLSLDELQQQRERLRSPLVLRCLEDYRAGARYPLDLYHDVI